MKLLFLVKCFVLTGDSNPEPFNQEETVLTIRTRTGNNACSKLIFIRKLERFAINLSFEHVLLSSSISLVVRTLPC